nr:T9SS type A sorting domain-containing protein [Saprospiraceae bacterium]
TATVPGATSDDKDSDVNHSFGLNTTRKISLSPGMTVPNINVGIAFGVLPVKWVDVDVISKNNQHIISWSTTSEVNVSHYEIERMLEGEKEFKTLNVKYLAKGDNNLVNYYNGTDIDIEKSGVYYYRIIQYDFDGKFTYSKTVFVSKQGENSIKMYPSPARNQTNLDITLMLNADVKIEMFDASARLIKTITNQEMEKGNHLLNIGLDDVQSGVYNLVIKVNDEVINKKLIKID